MVSSTASMLRPLTARLSSTTRTGATEPYICQSCLFKTLPIRHTILKASRIAFTRRLATSSRNRQSQSFASTFSDHDLFPAPRARRFYSSSELASRTAIDAPSPVPTRLRTLHSRLLRLSEIANGFIDISRLQLALRSLESDRPITRVAFLGLGRNGTRAARKLARAILADVLGDEANWERELQGTEGNETDGRAILLKFGEYEEVQSTNVLRTIQIPAEFLRKNNLEILITTTNVDPKRDNESAEELLETSVLVPALTTPTADDGRVVFIRYPVHRTVVVAEGVQGAIDYGRLPSSALDDELVRAAISVPLHSATGSASSEETATDNAIDVDLAIHGLDVFRASNRNGSEYSRSWNTSRVDDIANWLVENQSSSILQISGTIYQSINSILGDTAKTLEIANDEEEVLRQGSLVPGMKRQEIQDAITTWSKQAHEDLQYHLALALTSRSWKRIAWFRLLWRIDDVSASLGDILRLQWLTEAEQTLAYLSGRIVEAGLANMAEIKAVAATTASAIPDHPLEVKNDKEEAQLESGIGMESGVVTLAETQSEISLLSLQTQAKDRFDPPWPHTISRSRRHILNNIVPEMHRKAQSLLLGTLSTAAGSTALATWVGIASSGTMLYEAGAIAALGTVWSLRRLQKLWSVERAGFSDILHEDGRKVLAEIEVHLRKIAQNGGKLVDDVDDARTISEARAVLQKCQQALQELK